MIQPFRFADGGRIDRSKPLNFVFNGKKYTGYSGDTLASALLANGVRIVNRSFKFHRPRGILSAGVEESNALLGVDYGRGMMPVVRATQMPLLAGMRAESQNCFPSVNFDLLRVFDYTRPLWPAGFYNKVFKWPSWHYFEWAVRRAAGLGRLPEGEDTAGQDGVRGRRRRQGVRVPEAPRGRRRRGRVQDRPRGLPRPQEGRQEEVTRKPRPRRGT